MRAEPIDEAIRAGPVFVEDEVLTEETDGFGRSLFKLLSSLEKKKQSFRRALVRRRVSPFLLKLVSLQNKGRVV